MKITNVCGTAVVVISSLYWAWITLPKASRLWIATIILAVVTVFVAVSTV
jgi:hypothetical protein